METTPGGTPTLSDYLGVVRRRWWIVALATLVGLAASALYLIVAPKTYISTSAVRVTATTGITDVTATGARTNSGLNLDTEAQLVKSLAVSGRAKVRLSSPDPVDVLAGRVTVTVPPNSTVLRISYVADTPQAAQAGSAAFARAYLDNRRATDEDALNQQIDSLQRQLRGLQDELSEVTEALASAPGGTATRSQLEASRTVILGQIQGVSQRLNPLLGQQITPGQVISFASLPGSPASPNRTLVLASGLMLGALIGLALVAWAERRDGRIYEARSLERRSGLPILAEIPADASDEPRLLPVHSRAGQSFTQLRNVLLAGLPEGRGALVVSGADAGTGADTVAANLAAAIARADRSVTLVVADAGSCAPALLGIAQGPGLGEALRKGADVRALARPVSGVSNLSVVPPGLHLDTDVDDLEGAGIDGLLATLRESTEVVIVLAPATNRDADAQVLARSCDGALVVVELGRTGRDAVTSAIRLFHVVDTAVPGMVVLPAMAAGPAPIEPPPAKTTTPRPAAPAGKASARPGVPTGR